MLGKKIKLGIDIGSTTVKAIALDAGTDDILYSEYRRHEAKQAHAVAQLLGNVKEQFPNCEIRCALTGSGAAPMAQALGVFYVQEVVANAIAVGKLFPSARTAIELGGQDAKMIFFAEGQHTGRATVSDMRMNGSCAGGTGAFIDEIASLLRIPVEQFNDRACLGTRVYDVSGRCGVYAKTDIQPLLNQGVPKEDLALSTFHAIAKQTIGGLAQGLDITAPVIFEGGPLTFNPRLIQVFKERLNLSDGDIIVPKHPETIVALGAALSLDVLFGDQAATSDVVEAAGNASAETAGETPSCDCEAADSATIGSGTPAADGPTAGAGAPAVGSPTNNAFSNLNIDQALSILEDPSFLNQNDASSATPFFESEEEYTRFKERHALRSQKGSGIAPGESVRAYLGIDCGSTTTKFVLMAEDGSLIDSFYASNEGEPLDVAKKALAEMSERYARQKSTIELLGVGTTGYGEMLMHEAFGADYHVVETVAHAKAACSTLPQATFVLDIGGQDMKAIWLSDGIVTNIVVNEACSSGCGSFLENFASTLGIPTHDIAQAAFSSKRPAQLGSRCTVFMNSNIVTEQRRGSTPADIMAGLCRSIIENVFTKVIRLSNLDNLGNAIVVQGGTFMNDAVLRAFEEYLGKQVVRAPYPGLMGALGAAMLTQEHMEALRAADPLVKSRFIGFETAANLTYEQKQNLTCPFCANRCNRTRLTFSNGRTFITGNRCPKGRVVGDAHDSETKKALANVAQEQASVPNLFEERKALLFKDYPYRQLCPDRGVVIGLPRVLALWDSAPFWTTFFKALGFGVKLSPFSTRKIYESGLHAVTSDTVCFPAKLVHGHIRSLVKMGVDRIFMPIITVVPSEGTEKTAESMCAVVKGYPMVIGNSDNPYDRWGVPFDAPLWHWYSAKDRDKQLCQYMKETFGIASTDVLQALDQAIAAQDAFRSALQQRGSAIMEQCKANGTYAMVLASRPYQNDDLVNHDLPKMFTEYGIPVLTADSLPEIYTEDLSNLLLDVVNNFHARMLSTALVAARSPYLEYAQIVNFNCGHDAYLSDEIVRVMDEVGGKAPLVLKVDESDIVGPLRIRVRSFVETVNMRRARLAAQAAPASSDSVSIPERASNELADPYHSKFVKDMIPTKTVLVPNTSHAFSMLMAAAFAGQGLATVSLPVGREEAIRLGKRYVHNDICFPCQVVIGEALAALESGAWDPDNVAIAMGKYIGDCRLTHYTALLRKALDDAGYPQVPIITNDDVDYHNVHPGYKMNLLTAMRIAFGLPMVDALEELLRKMRPYELVKGSADKAFEQALELTMNGLRAGGIRGMKKAFEQAIRIMQTVKYDRTNLKPQVLIVGEYLLNFHEGANRDIERYLEENGMEIIEARMTDVIRKSYFYKDRQVREYHLDKPLGYKATFRIESEIFNLAHDLCDQIAKAHPLYEPAARMQDIVVASDPIIHHTFDAGEGVLIPAEIIHHAQHGCRAFVILQPFGCLPNHVVGRGITKKLKEMYPDAQILPLDYDPDMAQANIENRLQMLIMEAKAQKRAQE